MDNTTPTVVESNQKDAVPTPKPNEAVAAGGENQSGKCNSEPSVTRNRSSREEKMRKKDDKSVEHVLKALNSLNTTEEKLAAMCKKYADIFDENRKLQLALKQAEKRWYMLQGGKIQLQAEHSKAILSRSRLENLCRELQRQNKAIKDESLLKIREEEEKRKEVSAKFQSTLTEITALMQQNNDKNTKLRDDNIDMNAKLKNVCEQYELREQEVEKISKQMHLEAQLADAKLAKAKMEMAAEREILQREKQQLLMDITQYQVRCQEFQTTELNLRNQISLYDEKYDEFQKALARSNEVFGGFKGEMEKMSKKVCKLEKETMTWKQRWEGSHKALLEMAEDKQRADKELGLATRQMIALQRLCRTLQTERTSLLSKLKEAGGDSNVPQDADQIAVKDDGKSNRSEEIQNLVNGAFSGNEHDLFNCDPSCNNIASQDCRNKKIKDKQNKQNTAHCQADKLVCKDSLPNTDDLPSETILQNGLGNTVSSDNCLLDNVENTNVKKEDSSAQLVNSDLGTLGENKTVISPLPANAVQQSLSNDTLPITNNEVSPTSNSVDCVKLEEPNATPVNSAVVASSETPLSPASPLPAESAAATPTTITSSEQGDGKGPEVVTLNLTTVTDTAEEVQSAEKKSKVENADIKKPNNGEPKKGKDSRKKKK